MTGLSNVPTPSKLVDVTEDIRKVCANSVNISATIFTNIVKLFKHLFGPGATADIEIVGKSYNTLIEAFLSRLSISCIARDQFANGSR